MVIHYNEKLCILCQFCIEVCPRGCFELDIKTNKIKILFPLLCLNCKACEINCEGDAIKIEKALFKDFFAQLI
ncbi:MAG: 4Fe-4S binding protein [Candidatus Hodarchaeota archaeon]